MLEDVIRDVAAWQAVQFPHATAQSIAIHLREEAEELEKDPTNAEEMADIMFLLIAAVVESGVDLEAEMRRKLDINLARTWAKPDKDGVVRHIHA